MSNTNANSSFEIMAKVFLVYLLGVLGAMTVSEAVPALEGIAHELHPSSPALVGLVMSLPGLVVAVGALFAGYLVDRFGDKFILTIGAVVLIVGDSVVAFSHAMNILLGGRLVSGVGYVLINVAAMTTLIRITSGKQRTWALAFWSTFPPASWIIPLVAAGPIARMGWRLAFGGHAVLIFLCMAVALFVLSGPDESQLHVAAGSHTAGVSAVLRAPMVYLLGFSFAADAFLHNGIMSTTPPFLHRMYGVSPITIDHWNIGSMVVNAAGCLLLGRMLTKDISPKGILLWSILITAVPVMVLYAFPIGAVASVACICITMFGSGILTGMWAYAPSVAPSPQCIGATSGALTQFTLFGVLLSGPAYFTALASPHRSALVFVSFLSIVVCCLRTPIVLRNRNPHAIAPKEEAPALAGALAVK